MRDSYECGACASNTLVITVEFYAGRYVWKIACRNGHEYVAAPGVEIIITDTVEPKQEEGLETR